MAVVKDIIMRNDIYYYAVCTNEIIIIDILYCVVFIIH